jgi:hypothetical protein
VPGLVAALVAALALGAGPEVSVEGPRDAAGWKERNAARARAGLLPRKPPARKPDRRARRLVRLAAPPPVYLGEPAAVRDLATGPRAEPAGWVEGAAPSALRLVSELVVSPRAPAPPVAAAGVELAVAPRPRAMGLALAATGVVTDVALILRAR